MAPLSGRVNTQLGALKALVGGRARGHVIIMLGSVLALSSADSATIGASASQLRHALHISNADLGVVISASTAVGALVTVPAGALVDRLNRVRLLTVSIALWGVAMALSALASSLLFLAMVRIGLGVVMATGYPAVASLVGDYFPAEERSQIYGLVLAGELVGAGAGFVLAGEMAPISWRLSFGVLALPAFGLAWLMFRLPEPVRGGAGQLRRGARDLVVAANGRPGADATEEDHGPREAMPIRQAVSYVLRVPTNVVLIVSGASSYFFFAGVKSFGIEFATAQYHVSHGEATALLLVVGIGALIGVVLGGRLGDKMETRRHPAGRIVVAVIALEATAVIFAPALAVTTVLFAVPLLMAAAFTLGAIGPPVDAARLSVMPPHLWGRAEGIRSVIRQGAEALAPTLFGLVADNLAGGGHAGLQAAFFIMLIPLAAAGGVMATAIKTYPRDAASARR